MCNKAVTGICFGESLDTLALYNKSFGDHFKGPKAQRKDRAIFLYSPVIQYVRDIYMYVLTIWDLPNSGSDSSIYSSVYS